MYLRRKAYEKLLEWKNRKNHKPVIVEGLRQVGKSYIVDKFVRDNYSNYIIYDFRHRKDLLKIFSGNLDVDTIIKNSKLYFSDKKFEEYNTVLVFEEIGDCPLARISLKSFALDGRYDVIATGSLLGVINFRRKNKIKIPTGYEEYIKMSSLDFEEFLWATGIDDAQISTLKECTKERKELNDFEMDFYKKKIKDYMVVGGLPEAVTSFIEGNDDYIAARNVLERLLNDYRADFGRFVDDDGNEEIDYKLQSQLNMIFDSIPKQLARDQENLKFKFSEVKNGGRSAQFEDAFTWLEKAGLVLRCYNTKAIEMPLSMNADKSYFKAFISDVGLLMAMYPVAILRNFLNDELGSRKGAIYENLAAVLLAKKDFPLYYFSDGKKHLEIDYLIEGKNGIILYEEKSTNGKMAASKAVMTGKTAYKADICYKIIENNFGKGEFFTSIPQCCSEFLLDEIKDELYKI